MAGVSQSVMRQGRRLSVFSSLVRSYSSRPPRVPVPWQPRPRFNKPIYDTSVIFPPRPSGQFMDFLKFMETLHESEKFKFGYIFAELLGLPKPRKRKTKDTGDKFAVKLLKFDKDKNFEVLRSVAEVKYSERKMIYSLAELDVRGPAREDMANVPSVIIKDVSKEEATRFIAKIENAGGVAVMEPMKKE